MFGQFPEKNEFIIGILDFPLCVLPVSREKRIYDLNFRLFSTDIGSGYSGWAVLGRFGGLAVSN